MEKRLLWFYKKNDVKKQKTVDRKKNTSYHSRIGVLTSLFRGVLQMSGQFIIGGRGIAANIAAVAVRANVGAIVAANACVAAANANVVNVNIGNIGKGDS